MKKSPLQYALDLIAMRDRTVSEIRKKMLDKQISPDVVESTIQTLLDKKFLNDERFVHNYINSQKRQGRFGRFRIVQKMKMLGLSKELIDNSKSEMDRDSEGERARELAEKWLIKNSTKDKHYERLGRFLASRGFEIDVIKNILNEMLNNRKECNV